MKKMTLSTVVILIVLTTLLSSVPWAKGELEAFCTLPNGAKNTSYFSDKLDESISLIASGIGGSGQTAYFKLSNMLMNPGFEQHLDYWSVSEGTANYLAVADTFRGGMYSAKGIEINGWSLGRLYQDVTSKVTTNRKYKISGWIRTQNVIGGGVVIALDYVGSNGWTPADGYVMEIGYVTGTQDWTYFESGEFILPSMPADCVAAWFLFDFNAATGIAWFDDVSLVEILDWAHYHSYTEITNALFYLNSSYSSVVDLFSIGKSWQDRDIYCIRLTNEKAAYSKPKMLFVGCHHARELISTELPLYFVFYMAENYGVNATITRLLDLSEIYVVVALNVDGFNIVDVNEWQRKNAQPFDEDDDGSFDEDPPDDEDGDSYIEDLYFWNGTYYEFIRWEGIDNDTDGFLNEDWVGGVDLNRNYGYQWNATCDSGSPYPWAEDYRGSAPFSEPETQAIRDLALQHDFKYAISFHSGAEVILYPWGYTSIPTPHDALFREIAGNLSNLVYAPYGQSGAVLYTSSGLWNDWMYANRSTFAFTCEIYTNNSAWQYEPGPEPDTWWEKGVFQFFNPDPRQIEMVIQRWLPVFTYITNRAISMYEWPMFRHDLHRTAYSYSMAPNTSNLLWNYLTNGSVWSSPAVEDGKVYIGSNDNEVYCLDAITGTNIWNYTTGHDIWSSPAVVEGRVYVGSSDYKVYCLDASTGIHIWNYTTGFVVGSSPAVAYSKVYIGSYDGKIYCLDANTGSFIWSFTTGDWVFSSPAVAYGMVFVGSLDSKLYALNASTGTPIWSYKTSDYVFSSPAVADGKIFIGSDDGSVYCLNATTGAFIWKYITGSPVSSSPAVAYGNLYVGSDDGKIYAFGSHDIGPRHDIALTNITFVAIGPPDHDWVPISKTVVGRGFTLHINITIGNQGNFGETCNITIQANATVIATLINITLASGDHTFVTFTWNTSGFAKGNYTISAHAWPVSGDTDTTDNTYVDGWIIVAMVGDLTGPEGVSDGKCDMRDVYVAARAFGSYPNHSRWNPNADINNDGKVDMRDIFVVARNFGKTDP